LDKPLETYKFRFYNVKRFERPNCNGESNLYESSTLTFTITCYLRLKIIEKIFYFVTEK